MNTHQTVITILGSSGGAAKSILAILNKSIDDQTDSIHHKIVNSTIYLIDSNQKDPSYFKHLFPRIYKQLVLHQFNINDTKELLTHLINTKTHIVVDVSWADTVEMLRCCNQLGIKYVNSALENTMIDENEELYEGFPLIERIRFFEKYKDQFTNTVAIVGSGMNPGVVQWMAIELLNQETQLPLGCYIVEHDSTFYKDKKLAKKNTIYTSWSPECFLDEAIASHPMFMKNHTPLFLYEHVYSLDFAITLGDKQFNGALMPHEEVYSLCKMYDMEGGFIYKINDHTIELIRANLDNVDILWDYEMKVLDPLEASLEGEDLVGVLLVYEDHERYMYNVLRNDYIFNQYKTNATYFQVACGIYASLSTLLLDTIPNGVYYVDELLVKTNNQFGNYLTHYMTDFVVGENKTTDGLLLNRMSKR
ncbi:S-adenosylmethionine decarboxylase related protein [Bacillus sp. JJ722]|uniref:S-adenosylmethionine decarboxylase related protein n=1 Tax=Bacillus sp. JJ722 TaxID=3122973 RepID=UPI002FFE541E